MQLTVTASSDPSGRSSGAIRSAFAPTNESASDAIEVRRNSSNSSISSRASRGSNALMQGGVDDGADQLFPTPLFAAKLKRADGSKVFINIGTNDVLLPTETIVTKHVVSDASSEFTCYDYVIHPERAVMYTLLVPDSSVDDLEPAKDVLQAKNKIVYDAVKLISLKYGNLGLTGVEPSYPETRHNHKGNIHPFQRSPSKVPVSSTARYNDEITWNHTSSTLTGSVSKEGMSENIVDPPALCKGWVTVLGSGGKGLIGIGNKKRFVVLDGGLFSVYKKESDTPPYGHHKKDSIVLDGAIILDSQNTVESAKVQRRSSSVDPKQAQVVAVNAKRRGSVFGVNKEAEVKRLFINSAHGGKRIDIECESAADRARWSLALTQHADYAALRVNQPNLVTDSFVDEMHSDSASVVSEVDARRSVSGSSTVVKAVRRGSAIPTTWSAYFPYMQEGESVLEAGEVTVREGIFGRYGPPFDLVSYFYLEFFDCDFFVCRS